MKALFLSTCPVLDLCLPNSCLCIGPEQPGHKSWKEVLYTSGCPATSSIQCSLTKANPEQDRKLPTGRKVFAKCHSSGLGKEGREADCSDPSAVQNSRVSISFTQAGLQFLWSLSTAVHRNREPWEKS